LKDGRIKIGGLGSTRFIVIDIGLARIPPENVKYNSFEMLTNQQIIDNKTDIWYYVQYIFIIL